MIRKASDARMLAGVRSYISSPSAFAGTLEELFDGYIAHNLPSAESVERVHRQLVTYAASRDALFLVRRVRGTERGVAYEAQDGVRFKATDNAPAWWMHATLLREGQIADDAIGAVIESIPNHMFEIAKTSAPTANQSGWHIAHIFGVGDRQVDYVSWNRADVVGRFFRNVHPCNYVPLPNPDWQKWGADERVIAFVAADFARRYASVWSDFIRLACASEASRPKVAGPIRYAYSSSPEAQSLPDTTVATPSTHTSDRVKATYRASRLTFKQDVIEKLRDE